MRHLEDPSKRQRPEMDKWKKKNENAMMDVQSDTQRQDQERTHTRNNESGAGLQKDH